MSEHIDLLADDSVTQAIKESPALKFVRYMYDVDLSKAEGADVGGFFAFEYTNYREDFKYATTT